jgi:imidazolonepropionase-like amidohydrolase
MVMNSILFTNVRVIDGTGDAPFDGEVLIEGNRISAVSRADGASTKGGAEIVDGGGATLMPGLLDAHSHLSFTNTMDPVETAMIPPEDHTLMCMKNARVTLDHGITSCFGAAATKPRLDVVIRDAIDRGDIAGPRLLAASRQFGPTGGFNDERLPHLGDATPAMSICCDGPEEFRRATREACRDGVDVIKIVPSASSMKWARGPLDEDTVMSEAEIAAVCEVAHQRNRRVAAHARSAESIRRCVRQGVDMIYHATLADAETMDALEAARDRVFVGPAVGLPVTRLEAGENREDGPHAASTARLKAEIEALSECVRELVKRGVRVVPGGDYGFECNPHGGQARELEHFVNLFGFSPMQAIVAATSLAGEVMGQPGKLGLVKADRLADLLLVEGDPLADVGILRDPGNLLAIMKDGAFHKRPKARHRSFEQAAE